MSDLAIGVWVKRTGQKWHLVESVVSEDAITRCGRRMRPYVGNTEDLVVTGGERQKGELQVSAVMPLTRMIGQPQLCRAGCQRTVFEDDASTAPIDPTMDTP